MGNWLGDTGHGIGGAASASLLIRWLAQTHQSIATHIFSKFRIDVLCRD